MRIKIDDTGAQVSLSDSFQVLISSQCSDLERFSLWVLNEPSPFFGDAERVVASGMRFACTYPVWISLPESCRSILRECTHVFQAFNEPFPLPYGLTLYPVPSGDSGTNYLIAGRGQATLIAGSTCFSADNLYRRCSKQLPFAVTHLVILKKFATQSASISDLIDQVAAGVPVSVNCYDPVVASAVAMVLAEAIAKLPLEAQGSILVDQKIGIEKIPPIFEWLSEPLQTYLLKCLKYVSANSLTSTNLVLTDLVRENRVAVSDIATKVRGRYKAVISVQTECDGIRVDRITPLASDREIAEFYNVTADRICYVENPTIDIDLLPMVGIRDQRDGMVESGPNKAVYQNGQLTTLEIVDNPVSFIHSVV